MRFLISFGDDLCDHLPDQESRLRYQDKTLLSLPPSSRAKQFHVRPTPRIEQNHTRALDLGISEMDGCRPEAVHNLLFTSDALTESLSRPFSYY